MSGVTSSIAWSGVGWSDTSSRAVASGRPRYLKKPTPFLPMAWRSTVYPADSSASIRRRASLIRFALNPPASPRLEVSRMTAARAGPPLAGGAGWRRSGKRSASSGVTRSAMTPCSASAYGRVATTRSCARLSLDVETSSIVRVILRVLVTERIRPFRAFDLAISRRGRAA